MSGDQRFSFFNGEKSRDKLSLRPHGGKSVAYRLQNAPFVFTRQRVDVTDVLSALSYDGLLDVRAVRHSVSGGCRATRIWNDCLVRERQKTRLTRSFHRARVCLITLPHDFSLQPHANAMAILFKTVFLAAVVLLSETLQTFWFLWWFKVKCLFTKKFVVFNHNCDNNSTLSAADKMCR